jgi:hypothetical protein
MKRSNVTHTDPIAVTQRAYLRLFHHEVGAEEARQIVENITGFFDILAEWSGAARASAQASGVEAPDLSANDTQGRAR